MPQGIDPKAYAARITKAKKIVEAADPATKTKLKEMYPNISKESIVNKALAPKAFVSRSDSGVKTTTKTVNKLYRPTTNGTI